MRIKSNDFIVSVYFVRNNFVKTRIGECTGTSTTFGLSCHVSWWKTDDDDFTLFLFRHSTGDQQDPMLVEAWINTLCICISP